jgi:hypothetical protein
VRHGRSVRPRTIVVVGVQGHDPPRQAGAPTHTTSMVGDHVPGDAVQPREFGIRGNVVDAPPRGEEHIGHHIVDCVAGHATSAVRIEGAAVLVIHRFEARFAARPLRHQHLLSIRSCPDDEVISRSDRA